MKEALEGAGGHRVVVVGGGFAGLFAVRALARAPVEVTLVDRRNFHLFQPLLYQVATGGLSPADIASPLRHLFRRRRDVRVLQAEVEGIDLDARRVRLDGGAELAYDTLVVAAGAEPSYFGRSGWERGAPPLKTVEDATRIRARVLSAFERAERAATVVDERPHLTFAVVGGGPTGVELAGALAELARDTLRRDFRAIDTARARILLVEAGPRLLPSWPPELSARAREGLERLGVEVLLGALVTEVREGAIRLRQGEREFELEASTVLWAAGVRASPLAGTLAEQSGAELDGQGRVRVQADLTLPGHPEVLVLGDLAHCPSGSGEPLPAVAPVAMQQGRYAGDVVARRLRGRPAAPFRYRDKGDLATVGRSFAVARLGRLRFSGPFAWILWLFVHLLYLVGFANRVLVLFQWSWSYWTRKKTARLITEVEREPAVDKNGR